MVTTMKSIFAYIVTVYLGVIVTAYAGAETPRVKTVSGWVEGTVEQSGVKSFKGIPYADPPVGDLRWREPQPIKPWTGVKAAKEFGPRPLQPALYKDMIFRSARMSEDCLYLNVWSPQLGDEAKLPVLVYIHGGGMITGDGSEPRYDGESDARAGVVVVTINYRLGVLGFLALHDLTLESPHHVSGNYGLLDQRAALLWVRANIAAFGGDPEHVTIAGQSAGAMSVCAHMVSPLSRNLFIGAIGESGAMVGDFRLLSLKEAESRGATLAKKQSGASLAALRALSAEQLLAATGGITFSSFPPVLDHYFFSEDPTVTFATGKQADVPLLVGWNTAEIDGGFLLKDEPWTLAGYNAALATRFGPDSASALKAYPVNAASNVSAAAGEVSSDDLIVYNTWKWADLHSKTSGSPVFRYLFRRASPDAPGARHSAEIPYAMGNLSLIHSYEWTNADFQTSAAMQTYFLNFIKHGNPNSPSLPAWPWIQASIPKVMAFDIVSETIAEPSPRRFQFWDSLYYR